MPALICEVAGEGEPETKPVVGPKLAECPLHEIADLAVEQEPVEHAPENGDLVSPPDPVALAEPAFEQADEIGVEAEGLDSPGSREGVVVPARLDPAVARHREDAVPGGHHPSPSGPAPPAVKADNDP